MHLYTNIDGGQVLVLNSKLQTKYNATYPTVEQLTKFKSKFYRGILLLLVINYYYVNY